MKKKLKKNLSVNIKKRLHKKAWALMSEWTRRSERGICFTCGDRKHWKRQFAGHYIHKNCLDYEDINIHCQCQRCNFFLSGNLGIYGEKMVKTYGQTMIDALRFKSEQIKKFTIDELETIIDVLEVKIGVLNERSN